MSGDVAGNPPVAPVAPAPAMTVDELPYESYDHLPDDALCVICQMPNLDNVSMCVRGHNACRTCANRWVGSNNENSDKCASCRTPLHRPHVAGQGNVWVTNTVLNNMVDSFQIKCPNVNKGCTHTCKLTDMRGHVDKCEWREIACKCSGCTWKGPVCKWHDHMKEVDHGCYLVDMLLFTQGVCATLVEKYEASEGQMEKYKTDVIAPLKLQMSCIGTGQNQIQASLTALEAKAKWNDGSSSRTKQRDRKNQKDVDAAHASAREVDEQNARLAEENTSLKRKVEDLERVPGTQFERNRYEHMEADLRALPSVSEWNSAKDARDRFFRERDEARHEAHQAQQRIHDQHQLLKKMLPRASRPCPCTLPTCEDGGGSGNAHLYMRGGSVQFHG
jgi:hypothetical protein